MKRSTKVTSIVLIFFLIIAIVIVGRTMIGNHFKKKFSKRPPPGIIVTTVVKKEFSEKIENSFCIPFNDCINDDKTFKNKKELEKIFQSCLGNINEKNIVFSCGSGVTACVLALAYSLINDKYSPCIYDGSWAEYGLI